MDQFYGNVLVMVEGFKYANNLTKMCGYQRELGDQVIKIN